MFLLLISDFPFQGNHGPDGCAIFFKTSRFDLVDQGFKQLRIKDKRVSQVVAWITVKDKQNENDQISLLSTHLKAGEAHHEARSKLCDDLANFITKFGKNIIQNIYFYRVSRSESSLGFSKIPGKFVECYSEMSKQTALYRLGCI